VAEGRARNHHGGNTAGRARGGAQPQGQPTKRLGWEKGPPLKVRKREEKPQGGGRPKGVGGGGGGAGGAEKGANEKIRGALVCRRPHTGGFFCGGETVGFPPMGGGGEGARGRGNAVAGGPFRAQKAKPHHAPPRVWGGRGFFTGQR